MVILKQYHQDAERTSITHRIASNVIKLCNKETIKNAQDTTHWWMVLDLARARQNTLATPAMNHCFVNLNPMRSEKNNKEVLDYTRKRKMTSPTNPQHNFRVGEGWVMWLQQGLTILHYITAYPAAQHPQIVLEGGITWRYRKIHCPWWIFTLSASGCAK